MVAVSLPCYWGDISGVFFRCDTVHTASPFASVNMSVTSQCKALEMALARKGWVCSLSPLSMRPIALAGNPAFRDNSFLFKPLASRRRSISSLFAIYTAIYTSLF